ncbi:hypothetical protein ACTXO6_08085 [Corynebacterium variabile]|uniref:hypothetical protein n=1 Tax=Corynebacterium variabile TaxID=1727 RepID=UPI003BAF3967
MKDPAAFGRRLHHARVDRGLSQTGLAAGICSPAPSPGGRTGRASRTAAPWNSSPTV